MGMGYSAGFADTVSEKFIAKVCPKEYKSFVLSLNAEGLSIDGCAQAIQYGDFLEEHVEVELIKLRQAFERKTGLALFLSYQDPDHGDIYDDLEGAYWSVDGVYTYTKAGRKYQKEIQRKSFVTFG